MASVLGLDIDWFYIALRLDSVWRRQSKRSTRQHRAQTYPRSRPEAFSNMVPTRSLSYPFRKAPHHGRIFVLYSGHHLAISLVKTARGTLGESSHIPKA